MFIPLNFTVSFYIINYDFDKGIIRLRQQIE